MTSPKISNFRMAKRTTICLDKVPNDLDNYADHLLISYLEPSPVVDVYEKSGLFVKRINIQDCLDTYDMRVVSITKVLFPRIKWSDRKLEEFERSPKFSILKKFIVIGQCRDLVKDSR